MMSEARKPRTSQGRIESTSERAVVSYCDRSSGGDSSAARIAEMEANGARDGPSKRKTLASWSLELAPLTQPHDAGVDGETHP